MGLDIRVYTRIELIEISDIDTWDEKSYPINKEGGYNRETFFVYGPNSRGFEAQFGDMVVHGVYGFATTYGFRAGSYSGYNAWREWLCQIMLRILPDTIWNMPDQYHHLPFFYLINFSDCEGFIAGEAAQKLAQDFKDYQSRAERAPRDDDWYLDQYNQWLRAFEMAVDGGCVDFH